jgi:hypothetical protein
MTEKKPTREELLADIKQKKEFIARLRHEIEMLHARVELLPIDDKFKNRDQLAEVWQEFKQQDKDKFDALMLEKQDELERFVPIKQLKQQRLEYYQQQQEKKQAQVLAGQAIEPESVTSAKIPMSSSPQVQGKNKIAVDYKNIRYMVR